MLSPYEIAQPDSTEAFLFCAVTPIRPAPVGAVQNGAKRDSFSQSFCSIATNSSRLWRGLEQTAFK
ncbi:MAG: hypothetical protein JWQ21_1608 [Herminiimonas sp.]|nr:hypothetical protein [Herminiimonas sp.]